MVEFFFEVLIGFWPFWVGLAVVAAILILLRMYSVGQRRLPYVPRERLVTKAELRFYKSLRKAVLDDWEIFAMVRIADMLRVEKGVKNRRGWLNKILAKHIDFVLCDPNSLEIVMGIELDDSSHQRAPRPRNAARVALLVSRTARYARRVSRRDIRRRRVARNIDVGREKTPNP